MIWKKQPVGSKLSDLQNNKASKDTATQSAAGLMSAADKTKLDGVATGATAVSVVDNLNSDSTTSALSAAQGKALNGNSLILKNLATSVDAQNYNNLPEGLYYNTNVGTNCPTTTGYMLVTSYKIAQGVVGQLAFDLYANTSKLFFRTKTASTWRGWEEVALKSNISSVNGGVPYRKVGSVPNGSSFQIGLSSDYSQNAEYAIVCLNIDGNALGGMALLVLGRGTGKIKDLIGSMSTSNYSASYSSGTWTITNTQGATMFYTAIITK